MSTIKLYYRLFGKHEFSLYDGQLFSIEDALNDIWEKLPEAKVMGWAVIGEPARREHVESKIVFVR